MTKRRTTTHAELKAKRLAGHKTPTPRVEVPGAIKWIGGLVIVVTAFFAAVMIVLVAYQWLGVESSDTARATGRIAMVVLGVVLSVGGIIVVRMKASSASTWLGKQIVNLGIGPEAEAQRERAARAKRRSASARPNPPAGGKGRPPRR